MKPRFPKPGPGALITAAFIGPGTVTTCTLAGASFGFALLWGLVFSIVATIVLQEMAARLGIITGQGLGEALKGQFSRGVPRLISLMLVISAITIGNAAFQTGNILGASMGLQSVSGSYLPLNKLWIILTGILAFVILYSGSYKFIERTLITMVILMSISFFATAVFLAPPPTEILKGLFIPSMPKGSIVTLVGLIGTTVVPYNLFLYASVVGERYKNTDQIGEARTDMFVSVILGGLISVSIVITAALSYKGTGQIPASATDLAVQLQPIMGNMARYFIGMGLFCAGISSAITAPLAAAWATSGILGWEKSARSFRFRLVWMIILSSGILFSLLGFRPLEAILFAQAANGILLPVIAGYLLWVANSKKLLGHGTNGIFSNIMGIIVVLLTVMLGIRSLLQVFGML